MQINILAVVVAALSTFLVGGLWYSPVLFGNLWNQANGSQGKAGQGHPARVFGLSFLSALIAALAYALIMPVPATFLDAALQGLLVGAGIVGMAFSINYQFANRNATLLMIDGGYHALQFCLYGIIIGLWR